MGRRRDGEAAVGLHARLPDGRGVSERTAHGHGGPEHGLQGATTLHNAPLTTFIGQL